MSRINREIWQFFQLRKTWYDEIGRGKRKRILIEKGKRRENGKDGGRGEQEHKNVDGANSADVAPLFG